MDMEGLKEACKKLKISVDDVLVLGKGSSRHKDGHYGLRTSSDKVKKPGVKFAVQYCKDLGVFIAWNLQRTGVPTRTSLSVKAIDVENSIRDSIDFVKKNIEYSGWNEENVLVFKPDQIENFLINYVK